ncbi:MAG: acyl-CoA dehydratase activase [Clostridiales bacterium]|nr:acyl-CoA dehydratase activase [Clostridiales bacterium]
MYLGIDVGSVSTDAVLLNDQKEIIAFSIVKSGFDHKAAIDEVIINICAKAQIERTQIKSIVSTGYGRRNVSDADKVVTEISCHAMGIHFLSPVIRMVIDIGGQDSKVIRVSESGYAETFYMNDKCAAGTGRFLEVMAHAMGIDINDLGSIALTAKKVEPISSICTVFAESEVISKIAEGKPKENIIAGIHKAIGERLMGMVAAIGVKKPVALTGGVAKNQCIVNVLSKSLGENIYCPGEPQLVGALGAAIFAIDHFNNKAIT